MRPVMTTHVAPYNTHTAGCTTAISSLTLIVLAHELACLAPVAVSHTPALIIVAGIGEAVAYVSGITASAADTGAT